VYLREKGYEYEERNISTDTEARQELIKRKVRGVPAFLIGDEIVLGLDTEKIEELMMDM
jgi:glutaredoxin 3